MGSVVSRQNQRAMLRNKGSDNGCVPVNNSVGLMWKTFSSVC